MICVHYPVFRLIGYKISWKEVLVLTLGASKGAINIILSLVIVSHDELDTEVKSLFFFHTICITGLSIILNTLAVRIAAV